MDEEGWPGRLGSNVALGRGLRGIIADVSVRAGSDGRMEWENACREQADDPLRVGAAGGRFAGLWLDHLGIAVTSIAAARGFYEALGLTVSHEETVEHEKVKTAMLPLGESRIELLEATEEDSTLGRFVAKRGEGLHHVALRVAGVDTMFEQLRLEGVRLASDAVRTGSGGHRYFFVHPASTGGVLVEIVGDAVDSKREGK